MPSIIEGAFGVICQRIGFYPIYDVWVKTEFNYYAFQLDCALLPGTRFLGKPVIHPIDFELDDPSHERKKRIGKDLAREQCLTKSKKWYVTVPDLGNDFNSPPIKDRPEWMITRVPYSFILKTVRTYKNKKGRWSIKSQKNLSRISDFYLNLDISKLGVYRFE